MIYLVLYVFDPIPKWLYKFFCGCNHQAEMGTLCFEPTIEAQAPFRSKNHQDCQIIWTWMIINIMW